MTGTVIIRVGRGTELLGFETIESYTAYDLNLAVDIEKVFVQKGFRIKMNTARRKLFTKDFDMIEMVLMSFGEPFPMGEL